MPALSVFTLSNQPPGLAPVLTQLVPTPLPAMVVSLSEALLNERFASQSVNSEISDSHSRFVCGREGESPAVF